MILSIEEKYEKTLKENEILKMQVEYLKNLQIIKIYEIIYL